MKTIGLFFTLFIAILQAAASSQNSFEEFYIKGRGGDLFCRAKGAGSALIVVHGGPGLSQDYLLPQMANLSKHHRVIFYDQRACGRSTGTIDSNSISIATFVDDLESIRKELGLSKILLLGHSFGGLIAMHYAILHPDKVEKLILLNSIPSSSEGFCLFVNEWKERMAPVIKEFNALRATKEFAEGKPETVEHYYRIMLRTYCKESKKADLLNLTMTPQAAINGFKVSDLFFEHTLGKPFDFQNALKTLRIPTLIVHGDYDPIPQATAQKIAELIPGSQYIVIENCGHFPYTEAPEKLFPLIEGFLKT